MARRRVPEGPVLNRVLARARELAEQVRETAERVQQAAKEAHRLTEIARRHAEKGRELSRAGHDEARGVANSIPWSIDAAGNSRRCRSGDDET
jgi:methyl-accepting chemotaxis protein